MVLWLILCMIMALFSPAVLDLTEDDLIDKFAMGVSILTSLALAVHYPTISAAPHMLINGYKNVLALAVGTGYSFLLADRVKEYLEDPTRFAVAASGAAASGAASTAAVAASAEERNDEPVDESDDDLTFSLFD